MIKVYPPAECADTWQQTSLPWQTRGKAVVGPDRHTTKALLVQGPPDLRHVEAMGPRSVEAANVGFRLDVVVSSARNPCLESRLIGGSWDLVSKVIETSTGVRSIYEYSYPPLPCLTSPCCRHPHCERQEVRRLPCESSLAPQL